MRQGDLLQRLLQAGDALAAADEKWLPWWTGWIRGADAPCAPPGLPGEGRLLLRTGDEDDLALGHADALVAWRTDPALPWSAAPVLLVGGEGDLELAAGSSDDLALLLLAAGNLALELPRDAAGLRRLHDAIEAHSRLALERLRERAGAAALDLDALGARLAAAHAAHGPDLAPAPPPPARRPEGWLACDEAAPDLAAAFRPGAALAIAVLMQHEGKLLRLEGRPARAEVQHVGSLSLPSGRLAVGDLLVDDQLPPQPLQLPPGEHPVFLSLARLPGGGARVAAALLLLDEAPPERWERSWAFTVDSGTAVLAPPEALETWRGDDQRHGRRLERALQRGERGACAWARLPLPGGQAVLACSSGWGDGQYVTWIGRERGGRPVAVVAGFGLLPRDTPEGAPRPPRGPTTAAALGALRQELGAAMNRVHQGLDAGTLAPHLSPDVRLDGPIQAQGAEAVLLALARRPFGVEPITMNGQGEQDQAGGGLRLRYALAARPTVELGWVRLEARGARLTRISIDPDPTSPAAHGAAAPSQGASEEDRRLVEALSQLQLGSPARRMLVQDLRRQVQALGRPLSEEQRRKARELLR